MSKQQWTYYIYYTTDGEVYAYTDDKKISKHFWSERDHKYFAKKECKLTTVDIESLYDYYPEAVLGIVELSKIPLAITMMERVTLYQYISSTEIVTIPLSAYVTPDAFTDELRDALEAIGYVEAYEYYRTGEPIHMHIDPLLTFIHLYKHTLNTTEGGGIFEIISVLLNEQSGD